MSGHLVLVADSTRAKILRKNGSKLEQVGKEFQRSDLIGEFDKGAAKPGKINVPGGVASARLHPAGTHVYAPHTDLEEKQTENFLREVAKHLNSDFPQMESLVLIAPPQALGELRKLLDDHILAKVEHEVAKDLTKAREDEILEYVQKPYT